MAKQKLWLKKRTSRGKNDGGNSRKVENSPKFSRKNLTREIYKNQRWYSHFLLKFVACALVGLIWLQVGFAVQIFGHSVSVFPLGFVLGLMVLALEKVAKYRLIELAILLIFATASFLWPIGFTFK
jgi:hypothetical protein